MKPSPFLSISFIAALTASCSFFARTPDESLASSCLDRYDELRKHAPTSFTGYGIAGDDAQAVALARLDLAGQIITQISASASVSESNNDLSFRSEQVAKTEGLFFGLEIDKRCQNPKGTKEAVAKLDRKSTRLNSSHRL